MPDGTPISVDTAKESDLDGVWVLVREFGTSIVADRVAFDRTFPSLIERADSLVLVARARDQILGYLLADVHPTFFANGPVAWVEEVMVAASWRRTGVGRALVDRAERWASDRGSAYLTLATRRAGDFYSALGFEDSATYFRKRVRIADAP